MILWYLNASRTLLAFLVYTLQMGHPLSCDRLWDMSPGSHLPPGKTYEQWYGSYALLCPAPDWRRAIILCYGSNC